MLGDVLLTGPQVAQALGVSRFTVQQLVADGKLAAIRYSEGGHPALPAP